MRSVRVLWRSAITGRWVTAAWARLHPATTVRERRQHDTLPLPDHLRPDDHDRP